CREENGPVPRQNLRPAVRDCSATEFRQSLRRPSGGSHTGKLGKWTKRRHDGAVVTPTASPWIDNIGERNRRSALDRDFLQFAICKESHPLAIGREERIGAVPASRQQRSVCLVEQTRR